MLKKAGYIQRTRCRALDSEGVMHEVAEVHIQGSRYAIRFAGLTSAVAGRVFVQVEEIVHNWNYYLGATRGLAQVSFSGKALNIDIFDEGSFSVSLKALSSIMYGKERYACIVKIPDQPLESQKVRRITLDQKRISATA